MFQNQTNWPKVLAPLSKEQQAISDDFMRHWHEKLSAHSMFGPIENFNHGYAVSNGPKHFQRTLEIGAGLGEHLKYERLTGDQRKNYVALELRSNMVEKLRKEFPEIIAHQGDCQTILDFPDENFDRILAIHVLEHLPNLPAAVKEMHRLCNKQGGVFSVVIPCEGGWTYGLARRMSAQRIFEKRYKQPYKWFIEREHLSRPQEIISVLSDYFVVVHQEFFPFKIPSVDLNLCIGLTLKPKGNRGIASACQAEPQKELEQPFTTRL